MASISPLVCLFSKISSSSVLSQTDACRFGQSYLEKFGWDPSKGLGSSGEGRTSAIKASQKLDMLGIGMQHQKDPNGIAWRQNRDFENLLRRLNGGTDGATSPFHRAREEEEEEEEEESPKGGTGTLQKMNEGDGNDNDDDDDDEHEDVVTRKDKKKKKRKTAEELEGGPPDKKERKRRKKMRDGDARAVPNNESEPPPLPPPEVPAQEPVKYASMPGVTAPVPVPVSIRAPYVARSFCGS